MLDIPCSFLLSRSVFVSMLRGYYTLLTQHNRPHHAHTKSANPCISHTHTHTQATCVPLINYLSHTPTCALPSSLQQVRRTHSPSATQSQTRVFLQIPVHLVIFIKTDFKFSKCLIKYLFNYFTLEDFQS